MRATLPALGPSSVPAEGALAAPHTLELASYLGLSALVIAVVLCAGLLLHRVVRGGWKLKAAKRSLRVVDLLPLGGKRQLAVVQVYDRTLVLGLGEGGVRLLCEWDADGPLPTGPAPRDEAHASAPTVAPRSARARAVLAALGRKPTADAADPFATALEAALTRAPAAAAREIGPVPRAAKRTPKPSVEPRDAQSADPRGPRRARAAAEPEEPRRDVATRAPSGARRASEAPRHPTIEELLGSEGVLG